MFHVGQLVVCIDATPQKNYNKSGKLVQTTDLLEKGRIYTIRCVVPDYPFQNGPKLGLLLEDVIRVVSNRFDFPFGAERFRPVQKTDISIFTAMLNPGPVKEDA